MTGDPGLDILTRRRLLMGVGTASVLHASLGQAAAAAPASSLGGSVVRPEQFGAVGDGQSDDSAAIQRAIDSLARQESGGLLELRPSRAYRCDKGLELDCSKVSVRGEAILDFPAVEGPCIRVTASSVAGPGTPANNYGRKAMMQGNILIRGGGSTSKSIGIAFDSPHVATSAQMLIENVSVSRCGVGVRFGARAYNNLLIRCEVFECGTCVEYPAAEDNGERNTLLGCTLFNSDTAVRMDQHSGSLQLIGCSLDYTRTLYDVRGGSILATSCHHESSNWGESPIRCEGDGSLIRMQGGWILNQAAEWKAHHFALVGRHASVRLDGMLINNMTLNLGKNVESAFAQGEGRIRITNSEGYDIARLPARVHATRSLLSDPDFAADLWEDPVWRTSDAKRPIATREGGEGDNLRLRKVRLPGGGTALAASKAFGSTSDAAFALIAQSVSPGEKLLAGFRVAMDPSRNRGDRTLFVSPHWVRIDSLGAGAVPQIVRRELIGTIPIEPIPGQFATVAPLASNSARSAPEWATHFVMIADLVKAGEVTFLFNGLWCDKI